jgi:hypothetical protein
MKAKIKENNLKHLKVYFIKPNWLGAATSQVCVDGVQFNEDISDWSTVCAHLSSVLKQWSLGIAVSPT